VGSIMKGGAVALDGRIEPGDMILQVNEINFEDMSNDEAVRVLRDVVQKPGPIKLVVAKCWDPNPKDYFDVPKTEPVRPIDPGAWVAHTAAVRGLEIPQPPPSISGYRELGYPVRPPSVTTLTSSSPSLASTVQEKYNESPLTVECGMKAICSAMQKSHSGLEVRDRLWLKITIPQAFIGSEVVDWLFSNIQGFTDRRESKKYATQMLKAGFIKHTVNKSSFSEQCYYTFGDIAAALANCNLKDSDVEGTNSEADKDTLGPLPTPQTAWTPPTATAPTFLSSSHPNFPALPNLGLIYNPAPPPSTYATTAATQAAFNSAPPLPPSTYMPYNYPEPSPAPYVNPRLSQSHGAPSLPNTHSSSSAHSECIELAASGSGSDSDTEPTRDQGKCWQEKQNERPSIPLYTVPSQTGV